MASGSGRWRSPESLRSPDSSACRPNFDAHFTPCVEIGWRLAADFWNHGYATEGAREAMRFGFETLGLDEIVSITVPGNRRSRRVMEKLGMTCAPEDDFDHPRVSEGMCCIAGELQRLAPRGYSGSGRKSYVERLRASREVLRSIFRNRLTARRFMFAAQLRPEWNHDVEALVGYR
jgi:hypothetical protein